MNPFRVTAEAGPGRQLACVAVVRAPTSSVPMVSLASLVLALGLARRAGNPSQRP